MPEPTTEANGPSESGADSSATALELALLGIVAFKASSGYDIKKMFEETSMGIFSSSPGAIYPALSRLERRGWLASHLEATETARPRRVFTISGSGVAVLRAWLEEPVRVEELRQAMPTPLLRFSFMEIALGRAAGLAYLESYRDAAERYLDDLRAEAAGLGFNDPIVHPRLAMEHGVMGVEATLHWIERAIAELNAAPEPPALFEGQR